MMYCEFIGQIGGPLKVEYAPICLTDPDIQILRVDFLKPITNIVSPGGEWGLLRVHISDEDAAYLQLKYPKELSYIFTKSDK